MNTTIYTKLPSLVDIAMKDFAKSECVLVKKLQSENSKPLNCHLNVASQVKQFGGKVVNGWLLNRSSKVIGMDIWNWSFHSVWATDSGDLFDITIDTKNERDCSTFFLDNANRKIDLVNGVSYNDIVVFNNQSPSNVLKDSKSPYLTYGEVFWTANNMTIFRALHESNGEYRFLREEFPQNYKLLEKKYKLTFKNGALKLKGGGTHISQYVAFDFSVNLRT
jgi:hypothetical protein